MDERRVAVAEAIGNTGIEVLSNDKSALSLQPAEPLMVYVGRNYCIAKLFATVDPRRLLIFIVGLGFQCSLEADLSR